MFKKKNELRIDQEVTVLTHIYIGKNHNQVMHTILTLAFVAILTNSWNDAWTGKFVTAMEKAKLESRCQIFSTNSCLSKLLELRNKCKLRYSIRVNTGDYKKSRAE